MTPHLSRCKSPSCSASIRWRLNPETGRKVPLDATPTPSDDRFVVSPKFHYILNDDGETCRKVSAKEWNDHTIDVFCSHFRTCREVSRWAKPKAEEVAS